MNYAPLHFEIVAAVQPNSRDLNRCNYDYDVDDVVHKMTRESGHVYYQNGHVLLLFALASFALCACQTESWMLHAISNPVEIELMRIEQQRHNNTPG